MTGKSVNIKGRVKTRRDGPVLRLVHRIAARERWCFHRGIELKYQLLIYTYERLTSTSDGNVVIILSHQLLSSSSTTCQCSTTAELTIRCERQRSLLGVGHTHG